MKVPIFKRKSMAFDMANYYASNTDVWVYGTPEQYLAFAELIASHSMSLRVPADERGGMDLLVLPPAEQPLREFVVIHERLVHQNGRFNMELIIGGCRAGFKALAKVFRKAAKSHGGDTEDHIHFDFDNDVLIQPSVFLNVRGPVVELESDLKDNIRSSPGDLLPDREMEWRDPKLWEYSPIENYGSLFGRIPIVQDGDSGDHK